MTPCQQIMTSLSSHRFMTVLVQSGSQIQDFWYYKVYFLKLHVRLLTYPISNFQHDPNKI